MGGFEAAKFACEQQLRPQNLRLRPCPRQLHCPEDEPERGPLETSEFEFERRKISIDALRQEIFLEVLNYFPGRRQQFMEEQRVHNGNIMHITNYRLLNPGESQYTDDEESR